MKRAQKIFILEVIKGASKILRTQTGDHDELCDCSPCCYADDMETVRRMLVLEFKMEFKGVTVDEFKKMTPRQRKTYKKKQDRMII